MRQVHRTRRDPPRPPPLTRDAWVGLTYVEADGTICLVVCSGKMPGPDWPLGRAPGADGSPARILLAKGRA